MTKKQKILETATKLFMQEGYGRVSMDQVTRETGVSKATVYAHFKNKSELFIASLGYYQELHQIKTPVFKSKHVNSSDDLYQDVKDYSQQAYDYYNTDAIVNMYRILIAEINEFPELFEMFFGNHAGITKTLSDFFVAFARENNYSEDNCYILACQILDLVRGATIWTKLVKNPDKLKLFENQHIVPENIEKSIEGLIKLHLLTTNEGK